MKIEKAEFTALLADAKTIGEIERSLWEELEEDENRLEDGDNRQQPVDRSWYTKFGAKVTENLPKSSLLDKLVKVVKEAKVHFLKVEEKELFADISSSQGQARLNEGDKQVTGLVKIVRGVMRMVSDHGIALEFLRELFKAQDEKLTEVVGKVDAPGPATIEFLNHTIQDEIESKSKAIDDRFKLVEDEVNTLKTENVKLKVDNERLEKEVDETRQRGLKGIVHYFTMSI